MNIHEQFINNGNTFFRYRSYIPLLVIPIIIVSLLGYSFLSGSHTDTMIWEMICLSISFVGLLLRFYVVGYAPKGTSGRNTREQKAEVLNTNGAYSICRNPLYLANFIIWFGLILSIGIWYLAVIIFLLYFIFYERIIFAEEDFLSKKFGEEFKDYSKKTNIILPKFSSISADGYGFNIKKAISSEYSTFFAIVCSFTALEVITRALGRHSPLISITWIYIFSISLIIYLTTRVIKKKTELLN